MNGTEISADSQNFKLTEELFGVGTTQFKIIILTFNNLLDVALLECSEGNTLIAIICEFRKSSSSCTIIWDINKINLVYIVGTTIFSKLIHWI